MDTLKKQQLILNVNFYIIIKTVAMKDKKVKMAFAESFATLEKLIRALKHGISEYRYEDFLKTIESTKVVCLKCIKKEPEGSFECVSPISICSKWCRSGLVLDFLHAQIVSHLSLWLSLFNILAFRTSTTCVVRPEIS